LWPIAFRRPDGRTVHACRRGYFAGKLLDPHWRGRVLPRLFGRMAIPSSAIAEMRHPKAPQKWPIGCRRCRTGLLNFAEPLEKLERTTFRARAELTAAFREIVRRWEEET
jgi:hypothetical protein